MRLSDIYWCIRKGFPIRALFCSDINFYALPRSTTLPHPYGITVGHAVRIGENCCIAPNVTLGAKWIIFNIYKGRGWFAGESVGSEYPSPKIGSRVFIGAGTVIVGNVVIPDDVTIGAGSVITTTLDVKPGGMIAGNPARVIR
jgi:serine O-acetyltransferase